MDSKSYMGKTQSRFYTHKANMFIVCALKKNIIYIADKSHIMEWDFIYLL